MKNQQFSLLSWRTRNRLTLEDVADLSGVSVSMLSRVERGERCLSPRAKVLVAKRMGVKIRDLFPVEEVLNEEEATRGFGSSEPRDERNP